MDAPNMDPAYLLKLAACRMPFGRYKDRLLIDLPESYVVWFRQKGFPPGELGEMLATVYEIKLNGLEHLFNRFRSADSGRGSGGRGEDYL